MEKDATKNTTKQYEILKKEFDSHTVTTYSLLYRQIFKCNIADHKNLQEYGEAVTKARNKLLKLGNPLPELAVTCAFLDGLDTSYQAWKDMYLGGYSKNGVDRDGKRIVPTIEEMLKLVIDRESGAKVSTLSQSTTRAFKASQEAKKPKERRSSSKDEKKDCTHYLSDRHNSFSCWYIHPEIAPKSFCQRYNTKKKRKAALAEFRAIISEWKKTHPKKGMIANICANITASRKQLKDHQWYMDTAAAIHMTHDLRLYINSDLDPIQEWFKMADGHKIQTHGLGIIALETLMDGESKYVYLHNVHYCLELDLNLLSLGVLEKKGFEFSGK